MMKVSMQPKKCAEMGMKCAASFKKRSHLTILLLLYNFSSQMFLPWTIGIITTIISVFNFLLAKAFDSILAWYSRYGGEYANAIRWTRQGGYVEMVYSFINSRKYIPNSTKRTALVIIIASVVVSVLDKGISYFINPVVQEINPTTLMVESRPYRGRWELPTLSAYVHSDANITDVMHSMLNDTKIIPNAIIGKVYRPKFLGYENGCNSLNLFVAGTTNNSTDFVLPLLKEGCINATIALGGFELRHMAWENATITGSNGRWTIIASTGDSTLREDDDEIPLGLEVGSCVIQDVGASSGDSGIITSLPRTIVTKRSLDDGTVVVLSASTTRFSAHDEYPLHLSMSHSLGRDELIQAMELHENTTLSLPAALVVEIKVIGTAIDLLACYSSDFMGFVQICVYAVFNIIISTPQPIDLQFPAVMPYGNHPTTMLTIYHIPEERNKPYMPILHTKNASLEVTRFFAMLGQNFHMDWRSGLLYVLYDTYDIKKGVDAPEWLTTLVIIIMALSFLIWVITALVLDEKHGDSLYGIVSTQMATRMGTTAPMLMKYSSMKFEGPCEVDEKDDEENSDDEKDGVKEE